VTTLCTLAALPTDGTFPKGADAVASEAERADWHATVSPNAAAKAQLPRDLRAYLAVGAQLRCLGSQLCRFARVRSRIGAVLFHFRADDS
jgi:hypothetical protein